ncbi:MAG: 3'-5' exonuclease [Anaerolineales bacterium]|nr:3'-5' exonuclease [Anaerolineales bacterium]
MNIHAARTEAITTARSLLEQSPLFLDTETTGIDNNAEIVEIAIVDTLGSSVFNSLVKPVNPIPADAIRIHGITNQEVQNAPSWQDILPEVENILKGRLIGMYNAEYDLRLMEQSSRIHRTPWNRVPDSFCVMKLFAQYAGEWNEYRQSFRWLSLEKAAVRCEIPLPTLHRAQADAALTRSVFACMAESTLTLF